MGQAVRLAAAYAGLLDWATGVMQFFYWGPMWWKNAGYNWCFVDHRGRLTPMRARNFATEGWDGICEYAKPKIPQWTWPAAWAVCAPVLMRDESWKLRISKITKDSSRRTYFCTGAATSIICHWTTTWSPLQRPVRQCDHFVSSQC